MPRPWFLRSPRFGMTTLFGAMLLAISAAGWYRERWSARQEETALLRAAAFEGSGAEYERRGSKTTPSIGAAWNAEPESWSAAAKASLLEHDPIVRISLSGDVPNKLAERALALPTLRRAELGRFQSEADLRRSETAFRIFDQMRDELRRSGAETKIAYPPDEPPQGVRLDDEERRATLDEIVAAWTEIERSLGERRFFACLDLALGLNGPGDRLYVADGPKSLALVAGETSRRDGDYLLDAWSLTLGDDLLYYGPDVGGGRGFHGAMTKAVLRQADDSVADVPTVDVASFRPPFFAKDPSPGHRLSDPDWEWGDVYRADDGRVRLEKVARTDAREGWTLYASVTVDPAWNWAVTGIDVRRRSDYGADEVIDRIEYARVAERIVPAFRRSWIAVIDPSTDRRRLLNRDAGGYVAYVWRLDEEPSPELFEISEPEAAFFARRDSVFAWFYATLALGAVVLCWPLGRRIVRRFSAPSDDSPDGRRLDAARASASGDESHQALADDD